MTIYRFFFLFLLFSSLLAEEAVHLPSPAPVLPPKEKEKAIAASPTPSVAKQEIMIIAPEMRAKDIQQAFNYLKQANAAAKIAVKLTNGRVVTSILDIDIMPGGTLLIFKINSVQGVRYEVIKVEDIDTISHV